MARRSEIIHLGAAVASALAAILALYALWQADESNGIAKDSSSVAARGLTLAESNELRLNKQELQQYANKIYLGEPSPAEYIRHPLPRVTDIWHVVINASGLQAENVWVADDTGRTVRIQGLQRCSMYALPPDFEVKHLYFTDPYGDWYRPYGGQLEVVKEEEFRPPPNPDTDDSPWFEPVQNCAG